jgi:hypothetical protein
MKIKSKYKKLMICLICFLLGIGNLKLFSIIAGTFSISSLICLIAGMSFLGASVAFTIIFFEEDFKRWSSAIWAWVNSDD